MRNFSRGFLQSLPPLHYNVFVYLLSFLREALGQARFNRTTPTTLASFCVDSMSSFSPVYRLKQQSQLYHTLGAALNSAAETGNQTVGAEAGSGALGDTTKHSNPLVPAIDTTNNSGSGSGSGSGSAVQSLKDDGALELRRRALGAMLEYLLVAQQL